MVTLNASTDQTFEHYPSTIDTVYVPNQWYRHVQSAGVESELSSVVEREQVFFWNIHLKKMHTEQNKDEDRRTLEL